MAKDIVLKRFSAEAFMGIDHSRPVLIDFTARKNKGKNVVRLTGDQGTTKTSTILALMYALGATFQFDKDNLVNTTDQTLKDELEFEIDGVQYRVNATKTRFVLEMNSTDLKRWIKVDEPKTTLQKLVGHLGTSPMPLKDKDGTKQIDWFRETFGDEEVRGKEKKVLKGITDAKATRKDANREYTRLKNALAINPLYQDYEENLKKFKVAPSIVDAQKLRNEKKTAAEAHDRAVEKLNRTMEGITAKHNEIEKIKQQLIAAEKDLQSLMQMKGEFEKYIAENAIAKTEYQEAETAFLQISQTITDYNSWQDVVRQKNEMEEFETVIQRADAKKDELITELRKLTKKYLPEIPGLELKLNTGIDDDELEGIIYNGRTLAQLSESEIWGLYMLICEEKGVNFVFIENLPSLGTDAIGIMNMLAEKGVKIFATEMKREQDKMRIVITDKIE